jgi:hypothetical protein
MSPSTAHAASSVSLAKASNTDYTDDVGDDEPLQLPQRHKPFPVSVEEALEEAHLNYLQLAQFH